MNINMYVEISNNSSASAVFYLQFHLVITPHQFQMKSYFLLCFLLNAVLLIISSAINIKKEPIKDWSDCMNEEEREFKYGLVEEQGGIIVDSNQHR